MSNFYNTNEISEYRFDNDFMLKSQTVYAQTTKLKALFDKEKTKIEYKWVPTVKEYNILLKFEYQNKILIEDNLFELIELQNIFKLFSHNNLDTRNHYTVNDWEINLDESTKPFSLNFSNDRYSFSLTREQCSLASLKLQKVMQQLEPLPTILKSDNING